MATVRFRWCFLAALLWISQIIVEKSSAADSVSIYTSPGDEGDPASLSVGHPTEEAISTGVSEQTTVHDETILSRHPADQANVSPEPAGADGAEDMGDVRRVKQNRSAVEASLSATGPPTSAAGVVALLLHREPDNDVLPVQVRLFYAGGEECKDDEQCLDAHQHCDDGKCHCGEGYQETEDPDACPDNECRNATGGVLGESCVDVSNCSYKIRHVICDYDNTCNCRPPYAGYRYGTVCYDEAYGWSVAIKTAGITVMVLALGFLVAFAVKACARSRLRRRVPWLRRSSDVSFRSEDFYAAAAGFPVGDRPPSYTEEDANKPPSYEEVYPDGASISLQDGIENAAFTPDSPQRAEAPAAAMAGAPAVPLHRSTESSAELPACSRPAPVRTHRRGLSGPAALSLGNESDSTRTTQRERTETGAANHPGPARTEAVTAAQFTEDEGATSAVAGAQTETIISNVSELHASVGSNRNTGALPKYASNQMHTGSGSEQTTPLFHHGEGSTKMSDFETSSIESSTSRSTSDSQASDGSIMETGGSTVSVRSAEGSPASRTAASNRRHLVRTTPSNPVQASAEVWEDIEL